MSDTPEAPAATTSTVELTPQEQSFFDSKGTLPDAPPAEKPAEATPETPTPAPEQKEPTHVPLQHLHQERERRREAEKRRHEVEMENAAFRERFNILTRAAQQQEKPPPKAEEDIFGAIDHTGNRLHQVEEQLQEFRRQQQQAEERATFLRGYFEDSQRYAAERPDFGDAYRFLLDTRDKELTAMGYADPAMRAQALEMDEMQVAAIARQNKLRAPEVVYQLAVARGYKMKPPGNGNGNGDAASKLAATEASMGANRSLSSASGTAGGDEMTADRLLRMPIDEFEAWTNKNPKKARQLMGG